ncbi:hypothetical protein JTB14_036569 [Gonioctena quinquepunctata]|nr:hypothetical protein JTB14_036569 [Gonioctena quinquepunctata]
MKEARIPLPKYEDINLKQLEVDAKDLSNEYYIPISNFHKMREEPLYNSLSDAINKFNGAQENQLAKVTNDLWNSLLEPFGNKSTDGTDLFSKFNCPTEKYPYIFTRRNSPKSNYTVT